MKRFINFFSLTAGTQLCLLANQLLLLPLELRIWGQEVTGHWFVILAVANLASVADLGLRNAGHADLLRAVRADDREAAQRFRSVWALARLAFVAVTATLVTVQIWSNDTGGGFALWKLAVILSITLDTLVIVRGIWLDSLGHFSKVEIVFLVMVACRMLLCVLALTVFRAPPEILAGISLVTAVGGVVWQAWLFREPQLLGLTAGSLRNIRRQTVGMVPLVASEPALNWMRLSLPVVVLAAIAGPAVVTTYVGLRAIFGMARQVTLQLARFASVTYVERLASGRPSAERVVIVAIFGCTVLGAAVAGITIADNARLLRHWLVGAEPALVSSIAACFAVGVAGFGYQVINSALTRAGDVAGIAKRNYAYLAASLVAAGIATLLRSVTIYLVLLALVETLVAATYVTALGRRIFEIVATAFMTAVTSLAGLWIAVRLDLLGLFDSTELVCIALSIALGLVPAAITAAVAIALQPIRLFAVPPAGEVQLDAGRATR